MALGETYDEFVDKFKPKLTTDDCYTPDNIYEAVANWVSNRYSLDRSTFVRPFYPGGDYQAEDYTGKVVVDNPPFSIVKKIQQWYMERGIKFFLFAPALTIFSSPATAVCCSVGITYDNGASVATSFVTNLEPPDVVAMSCPELRDIIKAVNRENEKKQKKQLEKISYPDSVVTAAMISYMSAHHTDYTLRRSDCTKIHSLDAQRKVGKSIFGSGYLLTEKAAAEKAAAEKAAAEKAAAEKAAAEKAAATVYELSEREKAIIASLERR